MHEPTQDDIAENQHWREINGYAANPFCKTCRGFGQVHPLRWDGKPDYSKVIDCKAKDCLADAKKLFTQTHQYLVIHGVTERLQTFERFTRRNGTAACFNAFYNLAHGKTNKPSILCHGLTGNGKTHLCQALTAILNQRGISAYYYQAPALLEILYKSIKTNNVEEWITSLCRMDALVLDDFGSGTNSDWTLEKLQEIIDSRWTAKKITVVTMNKTLTELQQMSPRIYSRLCDQELSVVVRNEGSDYRLEKR